MNEWLVVIGALCLCVALVEAWMMVAVFSNPKGGLARLVPGGQDLLKSHIDYLMMSQLLFIFYLLFAHFGVKASPFLVFAMCVGSVGNAGLFLIRAVRPSLKEKPTPPFRMTMLASCVLTTLGYLGGALTVGGAAVSLM